MPEKPACWCGATAHERVRDDYAQCRDCGSVFYAATYAASAHTPSADDGGYYGSSYWQHHVPEVLGLPTLDARAAADLTGRDIYYLRRVLDHLPPGSSVLEIGCAPGSLGYLLRQAGMDFTGLEASTVAVDFARRTFDLVVHRQPVEALGPGVCFDAVIAIDVLEHLPHPLQTLEACVGRLASGGRLILQTPCYRGEGADWPMLVPAEHLFLFTAESIGDLLGRAGFGVVEVSPSLFPYDMWVVAAREAPLRRRADPLGGLPPIVNALVRMDDERTIREAERAEVERDREAKEVRTRELSTELEAVRADQHDKEALIAGVSRDLDAARTDQRAKETLITRLSGDLAAARADQQAKDALIARVSRQLSEMAAGRRDLETQLAAAAADLAAVRADQRAKEALISQLAEEIEAVRTDQHAKEALIAQLSTEIGRVRADQQAKEALIERINEELAEVRADQQAKETLIRRLAETQPIGAVPEREEA